MNRILHNNCPNCGGNISLALKTSDFSISKEYYEIWQCSSCQLKFTQNIPDQENIGPYYKSEDYISHSDNKKGIVNKVYHMVRSYMLGRKERIVREYSANKKVLDYGTGTGYFANELKKNQYKVQAIEIDSDARNYAKSQFGLDVRPIDYLFSCTDTFDAITLWHVFEHIYDLPTYVKHFSRILDKNGHLIIAVPNSDSIDAKTYQSMWAAYDVPRHIWHFTPTTLPKVVEKHGFSLVKKYKMPFDSFYVSLLSEKYKGSRMQLIKGLIQGMKSYIGAINNVDNCSSVIYVFKKNH